MRGQGSPCTALGPPTPRALWCAPRLIAAALIWLVLGSGLAALAAEQQLQLRVAWGGGAPRQWLGTISLSQGTVRHLVPLGVETDDPGSLWLDRGTVRIQQTSPRAYSALDVYVSAPADAKLIVSLLAREDHTHPAKEWEIPLSRLIHERAEHDLDKQGNRALVRRAPGDMLRVQPTDRAVLIYAAGEAFRAQLQPYRLPLDPGTMVRFRIALASAATNRELWSDKLDRELNGQNDLVPLEFKTPEVEGVYTLTIEASPRDLRSRIGWQRVMAKRSVQFVVLQSQSPLAPVADTAQWKTVLDDAASPTWWKRLPELPLPKIPGLRRGPLHHGGISTEKHPLGPLTKLAPPSGESPSSEPSWTAYVLPLSEPGRPHILEVQYPANVPQTLGISIVEPNAAGQVVPIGLDSGVYLPSEAADRAPQWHKHQLIFWPRTKAPVALLANRRPDSPAVFGKVRVLAGPDRLPRAAAEAHGESRLALAYLDRPLLPESFSAEEQADPESQRTLDSWLTFYQGASRAADYLRYAGYNGLMMGVWGDGGTIYPSSLLQPNTRYDSGPYFGNGQDPLPKDALELALRIFDRERLLLIPALDFSTPLPQLEELARQGGAAAEGLRWIGSDGRSSLETQPARHGFAPYYNTLHPLVQDAMRRVVQELTARYAHHPSFAGVALQLSPDGYALLPGAEWGFDDSTVSQFERDLKITVPGQGASRFSERAALLTGPQREAWLSWRAGKLRDFYRDVQRDLALVRTDARLYLSPTHLTDSPAWQTRMRPTLPSRGDPAEALLEMGWDAAQLRGLRDVVVLRPRQAAPLHALRRQAVSLELDREAETDAQFADMPVAGGLCYHPPQPLRLKSFDEASPFKNTFTWLVSQPLAGDAFNRQRLVHALAAADLQVFADGGRLLPLGQEEAVRDVLATFRQLPPTPFQTVPATRAQPLTLRTATWQERTYFYLLNDSPWPLRARLRAAVPPQSVLQWLGKSPAPPAGQDATGIFWDVDLAAFDLAAGWFNAPGIALAEPQVQAPPQVALDLEQKINRLAGRMGGLHAVMPADVLANPSFEAPPAANGQIPGWVMTQGSGVAIRLDGTQGQDGKNSAYMSSTAPVASLASDPFEPPATGRLTVLVSLHVADATRQPPLRIAIEGQHQGRPYYRYLPAGSSPGAAKPLAAQWEQYLPLSVDDLPADGLEQLRVRFDLMGAGEVWIDSVQLFDVDLSQREQFELLKLIQLANVNLEEGKLSDCRQLLQGYWPRFLEQFVPETPQPPRTPLPTPLPTPSPPPAETPPPKSGWLDRAKEYVPGWMRF
jgi:hypothetical protein